MAQIAKLSAQLAKLSAQLEIKSPAHKIYGFFRNDMGRLVQMFPEKLKSFKFLEGDDFTTGAVMYWKYDIGGETTVKAKVESVDEENKTITYEALEGDLLKLYSLFKVKFQAADNGDNGGATVTWSLEFQKANDDVPSPDIYIDFAVNISRGLDVYLSKI